MKQVRQLCFGALVVAFCAANFACSGGELAGPGHIQGTPPPPAPSVTSVVLSPSEVEGGQMSTGTVIISAAAPSTGATVTLSSDTTQTASLPSPTVVIPSGQTSATFMINTFSVTTQTTVNISATLTATASAALKVDPPTTAQVQSITIGPPTSVESGGTVSGKVTLTLAPTTPAVVELTSSLPTVANFVSSSVPIAAGQTTGTFTVTTTTVTSQTVVTITASLNNQLNAPLTVVPLEVSSLAISPAGVTGGQGSTGTVTLGGAAPAGGAKVTLSSNSVSAVVPATVTVPASATSTSFAIVSNPVAVQTMAMISASLNGSLKSSTLTINPAVVAGLAFSPTNLATGQVATATVSLNANAPAGGLTVDLMSSSPTALSIPATLLIPANTSTQTFSAVAESVSTSTAVTVTATTGTTMVTQILTVIPAPVPLVVTFSPTAVTGGNSSIGTATITQPAPAGGIKVSLFGTPPSVVTVPASITIPAGSTSQTFTATTTGVATATTATVTGTVGESNTIGTFTVNPATIASFMLSPGMVYGGGGSMGTVVLSGPAPAAGLTVTVMSSNTSAATAPASFNIAGGATSGTFNASSFPVAASTVVNFTATLPSGNNMPAGLTVNPPVVTMLSFTPGNVVSGQMTTGTVTLNGNAPAGGYTVSLSSNSTALPVPATVVVPANMNSQTFTATGGSVAASTPVMVTATTGATMVMGNVTVVPLTTVSGVSFNPGTVTGGTSSTGTVTINQAAPAGGLMVSLSSSDPSVTVPVNVTVGAGNTSQTFTATTVGVAAMKNVMVTATLGASNISGSLTVNPAVITSFTFSPSAVTGGAISAGTVNLSGPAPPTGLTVTLMSNNTSAATVPASFNIAGGGSSGSFNATTLPVAASANVSITATLPSGTNMSAGLTVNPPVVTSLSFNPANVVSGQMTTGTVMISGNAPAGGLTVTLTSNNTSALPVPASVLVAVNTSSQTFMVTAGSVGSSTQVMVTAKTGSTMVTGNATVVPSLTVSGVSFSPAAVTGGTNSTGTVTISQAAPAGGITVTLSSGDPAVTVPGSVTIAATKTSQTFTATTAGVAMTDMVTVTATVGASNMGGILTVNPATIKTVIFSPSSVTGGVGSVGTVTLNGPAPAAGLTVMLMSNNTSAATVPVSFNIAGAANSGTFNAATSPVAASTNVSVTATLPSGTSLPGTLTVVPPMVTMVSFSPATVASGEMSTGTVTLNGNAPTGGYTVSLSSNSTALPVPATVVVPAGMNSQTFVVTAGAVNSSTQVTVTATTGATMKTASVTVNPVLTASTTSVTFSGTLIGITSSPQGVTLMNNSTSSVAITSIVPTGDFGEANNCPAMLGGGAMCTIAITFTPTQAGTRMGTVTVTSMAPGNTVTINLTGTGLHWIELDWTDTDTSVVGYNVYRGTVPGGPYGTQLNTGGLITAFTYMDSDPALVAGTTYYYVVTAVNSSGVQSAQSNQAMATFP